MARGQSLYDWCQEDIQNRGYLLEEWDTERNEQELGFTPYNVAKSSHKYTYWVCKKCANSWKATVDCRTQGSGCRKCYSKTRSTVKQYENSLEYLYPNLMKEWDYEKNKEIGLDPSKLYPSTDKYAYWICEKCNYSWKTRIYKRTLQGSGCRKCKYNTQSITQSIVKQYENSLEYLYPNLMKEWDYEKNKKLGLDPAKLYSGSNKDAYWICKKCSHSWKAYIKDRVKGIGCPCCANRQVQRGFNDLATTNPELLEEWDYEKNNKLGITPYNVVKGSTEKVFWICKKCNYSWRAIIHSRTREGTGCSNCNDKSRTERLVKDILTELNILYQREWKQQIKQTDRYYDFFLYNNRLVIEVDGLQHFKYFVANYFDGDIKADNDKNDYLLQVSTPLLRLPGLDTLNWLRRQVGLETISTYQFKPILKKYIVNFINTRKIPFDIIQDYKTHSNTNYYEVALKMNEMEDKRNANEF